MTIFVRLRPDFKLVHEPITKIDARIFEEEEIVSQKLRDRLRNSTGGTFLVTGFRGVGKTTVVHQALRQLTGSSDEQVINVTVPVARPLSTSSLLFVVIRRLVERLSDLGIVGKLSPTAADRLLTAYQRTSYAHRETSTTNREKGSSFSAGGKVPGIGGASLPTLSFSRTRNKAESKAKELSFLAYGEGDVEHDFLRIVDLLGREDAMRSGRWSRIASRLGLGSATRPLKGRIVIVFDEIDKLTEADGGLQAFEAMLGGLKNLLASSGAHFIVVGGVDLHDEWLRETATANSLYRSVFAWQGYVGCSWQAPRLLLEEALAEPNELDTKVLTGYLAYRGRGIIRNVLYEFNELVEWDAQGPLIKISGVGEERVRLFSELATVLEGVFAKAGNSVLAAPSENDRLRQASYFTIDWVLRAGRDAFTVADVLDPRRGKPLDQVLRPRERIVHTVLSALVDAAYLEVGVPSAEKVTEGPEADPYPEQYELSDRLLDRLERIAGSSPRGRAEFGREIGTGRPADVGGAPRQVLQETLGTRYKVRKRVGKGGFGTVWSGLSKGGKRVALKVIRTRNPEAHWRAMRESKLLRMAETPGVVELIEVIEAEDRVILVTELVEGTSLADVSYMSPAAGVGSAIQVARTLEELHERGIIHADIKPSNLILTEDGRVVLIDLGTAQLKGERSPASFVGTPAYMAPELTRAEGVSDRSDVWSLGLLLMEMLTGSIPRPADPAVIEGSLESLGSSQQLKETLLAALADKPADRPSAAELRRMLQATPEAGPEAYVNGRA